MVSDAGKAPTWLLQYMEAWNSHDPARLRECLTDDAVFNDTAMGERFEGADAIGRMLTEMTETFSTDFRLEQGELVVVADDLWSAEWTLSGTNDREDPVRGLPNTGRPFRIHGLSIGRTRDGKISEEHLYWNMAEYLTQVGLMAQPASATV
jgi:steroid delta-isomerase-like uncharacterized protein